MKILKTSNLILFAFGISIVILIIAQVKSSIYHKNSEEQEAIYKVVKIDRLQPFKYLVLEAYRNVTFELNNGKQFKIETIVSEEYTDICNAEFRNDTLFVNVEMQNEYSFSYHDPVLKITIPTIFNKLIFKINECTINNFQQDTLIIESSSDNASININGCSFKTLNFSGENLSLSLNQSDIIEELNFVSKGSHSKLDVNDLIIKKLNVNQDSTEVILNGKSINYYLNR
ncbi:MAG: hypothetical protein HXX18_00930 [Bacteroidetes bacterium]|nr:hypothetical protein [Bacteroidota bacterium]